MFVIQLNSIMKKLVKVLSKKHQHIDIGRKETCSFLIDYMSSSTKDTFTRNRCIHHCSFFSSIIWPSLAGKPKCVHTMLFFPPKRRSSWFDIAIVVVVDQRLIPADKINMWFSLRMLKLICTCRWGERRVKIKANKTRNMYRCICVDLIWIRSVYYNRYQKSRGTFRYAYHVKWCIIS